MAIIFIENHVHDDEYDLDERDLDWKCINESGLKMIFRSDGICIM